MAVGGSGMSVVLVAASACLAALPPCRAMRPEAKPELFPNNGFEIFVENVALNGEWYKKVNNRIQCDICWRAADFRASAQKEGKKSPSAPEVEKEVCNQYYAPSKLLSKKKVRISPPTGKVDGTDTMVKCKKASEYAVFRNEKDFVADTREGCKEAALTTGKVLEVRKKCPEYLGKCGHKTSTKNSEAVKDWPQCLREVPPDVPTFITDYVRSSVYPYQGPNNGLNDEWYDDVDNRILCDICWKAADFRASLQKEGKTASPAEVQKKVCDKYYAPNELLSKEVKFTYVGVEKCKTASEYTVFRSEEKEFVADDTSKACKKAPKTAGRKLEARKDCPGYLDQCETTPQCSKAKEFFSRVYPYEKK